MVRIIILVLMHIIGDFILQGSKLSKRKILKLPALFEHTGIYTATLIILSPLFLSLTFLQSLIFSFLNGVLHFVVDFVTCKVKKKYWEVDEEKYFKTIGLDQTLHIIILIVTYLTLFPDILKVPTIFDKFDILIQ